MGRRMRIVFVDDELPIREEIQVMKFEAHNYELSGVAANGREALTLCRRLHPDIVITDVNMPVMDGLELMKILLKELPRTKCILLSCYQDFAYAKKAIEYGAVDYILKTDFSEENIFRALDKTRSVIEKEEEYLRRMENEKRVNFSRYSIHDEENEKDILLELKRIGFTVRYNGPNYFLVIENRMGYWGFMEMMLRDYLNADKTVRSWILLNDGLYGICLNENGNLGELVVQIQKSISRSFAYFGKQFRVYGVESHENIICVKQYINVYRQLKTWKAQAFYRPNQHCFSDRIGKKFGMFCEEQVESLEQMFLSETEIRGGYIESLRQWCIDTHLWPEELKKLLLCWSKKYADVLGETEHDFEKNIREAVDLDELVDYFNQFGRLEVVYSGRREVRETIRIMRTECGKNLTLSGIADRLGISAQYLGRLFTEETNEKFNDYLNRIRMEQAYKLLQKNELKVYEVAEKVGIENYRYFTQKFKEYYGISPKKVCKGGKGND